MKVHGIQFKREKKLCSRKHVLLLRPGPPGSSALIQPCQFLCLGIFPMLSHNAPFPRLITEPTAQPVLHITPLSRPYISECLLSIRRTETSRASTLHPRELPVKLQLWKSLPEDCWFGGLKDLFLFGGAINPRLEMLWESPHSGDFTRLADIFHLHTFQFNSLLSWNFLL